MQRPPRRKFVSSGPLPLLPVGVVVGVFRLRRRSGRGASGFLPPSHSPRTPPKRPDHLAAQALVPVSSHRSTDPNTRSNAVGFPRGELPLLAPCCSTASIRRTRREQLPVLL